MRWDISIHQVLLNIVNNTYDLMNSFYLPGTTATPWDALCTIILLTVIAFALKMWLGMEVGIWESGYKSARKSGHSPVQSAKSSYWKSRSRYVGAHFPNARDKHRSRSIRR